MYLSSNGVIVAKATFILVPAMHGTDKLFIRQIEELGPYGKVLTVTFPQRGQQSFANLCKALVKKAESVRGKIVLVGHSTGAAVILSALPELASRVLGVILINSGTAVRYQRVMAKGLAKVIDAMPDRLYRPLSELVFPFSNNHLMVNRSSLRTLRKVTKSMSPQVMAGRLQSLANFNPHDLDFSKYKGEVLVVASMFDLLVPSFLEAFTLKKMFSNAKVYFQFLNGHDCIIESGFELMSAIEYHEFLPNIFGPFEYEEELESV